MEEEKLLKYFSDYLMMALDELTETPDEDEFVLGEVTAYVDCLEILAKWRGFDRIKMTEIVKKCHLK